MYEEVEALGSAYRIKSLNGNDWGSVLSKGTLVMVRLCHLFSVSLDESYHNSFKTQKLSYSFDEDLITLLRYEGDGKFSEFYTGEIVQYAPRLDYSNCASYYGFVKKYSFEEQFGRDKNFNSEEFAEMCSYFLEHPILINCISAICNCEDNIASVQKRLVKQFDYQENIIQQITSFKEKALENFQSSYESYKKIAIIEEQVENFKNGISLSMSLKKKEMEKNAE